MVAFIFRRSAQLLALAFCALLVCLGPSALHAEMLITAVCPQDAVQAVSTPLSPGGIIITAFDASAIWAYDVARGARYPLEGTIPCGANCRLSPDGAWLVYYDVYQATYNRMRLDGSDRSILVRGASELRWWADDTFVVWTPSGSVYLMPVAGGDTIPLPVSNAIDVQPGGRWVLTVTGSGESFVRRLVYATGAEEAAPPPMLLGRDRPYFAAAAWSPDGQTLAYVSTGPRDPDTGFFGGELYALNMVDGAVTQWTDLTAAYGASRIGGHAPGSLYWSPDGTQLAFWVTEMTGRDPVATTASAVLHVLDVQSGVIHQYCGVTTAGHTPNPPRLAWSPDGTHLAFAAVPTGQTQALLLALDVRAGTFTVLSSGVPPIYGRPDVIGWGIRP